MEDDPRFALLSAELAKVSAAQAAQTAVLASLGGTLAAQGAVLQELREELREQLLPLREEMRELRDEFGEKVELTGKGGGPIVTAKVDLSEMTDEQLAALERLRAGMAGKPASGD